MKRSGLNAKLNKKLVQQVETRWNSKLAMLRSVAEAHSELLEEFSGRKEVRDRLLKVNLDLLQGIVKILEPFREASEILQAERVPTLHLVVKCANKLRRGLRPCPDDSLDIQLVKKRLTDNIHRLRIEPLHLAAHALQPDWRQKSYGDWADVREGHRLLLAKATEEAACFTAGEEVQEPRQREARAKTKTFLDSDSDSSDVESVKNGPPSTPSAAVRAKRELDSYLLAPGSEGQDILSYWRGKENELPLLAKVARSILAIPASNTSSERSFSVAGRVIEERRTRLAPDSVDALLFLNSQAKREL
ncbi:putative AC transposase [Amphibalanus amphitrite]|uniref:Putative AC transposase n=1 Tax=Amphibalanus amphitrite TaxID=1232801 RepID=A0A6A4VVC2_AMPAM|nr:putative AC transposase [Amphibalanus amphitrite]